MSIYISFLPGDEVVFNFTSGHNVNWVDETTFDSCSNITDTTPVSGPITWTAPQVMIIKTNNFLLQLSAD